MENCQICNQPAHGNHFGASTCRACAAFFRRCHISSKTSLRCRLLTSNCAPDAHGRWKCKKCRWARCTSQGMTPENVQLNRDAFKSSDRFVANRRLSVSLEERVPVTLDSHFATALPPVLSFKLRESAEKPKEIFYVDMGFLVEKASETLRIAPENSEKLRHLSNLEQLSHGLGVYRSAQSDVLCDASVITKDATLRAWEDNLCAVAEWLNYSENIRALAHETKMELLQCTWIVWTKLERVAMTAQMRVNGRCGRKQFVASHNSLLDYDKMRADVSWWSNFSFEELTFLFTPTDVFYEQLICEIIEIHPDQVELTYLLCNLCFGLTGKTVGGEVEMVTDRLQEALANDLHQYYHRRKKEHYALRMRQLMRINEMFIKMRNSRIEKYLICARLDVFESHFSHNEYFRISC